MYRGPVTSRRAAWSWNDSRDVARAYAAGRLRQAGPGAVWTALVEPDRLLVPGVNDLLLASAACRRGSLLDARHPVGDRFVGEPAVVTHCVPRHRLRPLDRIRKHREDSRH